MELCCLITGKPCGIDTWVVGCPCDNCQQWFVENQEDLEIKFAKIIDDSFWDLI